MGEIIRSWLQSRLGVIIDLTPQVFGHYSKDGTLLAKLLYNYDIINDTQLETIIQTQDSSLARVNLRHLRAWLKFIGVDFDDDCIEDISNEKGTASLRVFYKLFLCLETKDRLHFITMQKERERNIASSAKFDVSIISEKPPPAEPSDHPLSAPLVRSADVIEWHRKKFLKLIDRYKHDEKLETLKEDSKHFLELKNIENLRGKRILDEENIEINDFTHKSIKLHDEHVDNNSNAAKKYIKSLHYRKNWTIAAENSKNHTQQDVLSSIWGKIEKDQGRKLDEMIAKKVLKESHYEKQMLKKLCEIRRDRDRISDSRRLVESLMQKSREESFRLDEERKQEELKREIDRIEDENRRLKELKCRIDDEKVKKTEEYLQKLGRQLIDDLTKIALDSAEYKILNHEPIPRKIWNYWKGLFIQGLSVLDAEEILQPIELLQRGEEGELVTANPELIKREKLLDKIDLDDYLKLNVPWNEFIPQIDKESQCFLKLGTKILGYIVYKLLAVLHPSNLNSLPPLPDYPVRIAILGLPDSSLHSNLQQFLSFENIETVRVKETINFCLQKYKQEIKEFEYVNLEVNEENADIKLIRVSDSERKIDKNDDKNTQTPKLIPYEDMHPLLSDAAFIGKCIYELLTHGKKISEELLAKALVAYLQSVRDIRGWVVIDYPETYQQLINLESVLSGRQHNHDIYHSADDMTEEADFTELFTSSRLVDNPLVVENNSKMNSNLTLFIRIKTSEDDSENDVDQFYKDQGLASVFQYDSWNLETLEKLCRFIIDNGRGKTEYSADINDENESLESFESRRISKNMEQRELQPGESGWIYADVPRDKIILKELALHWINLESSYINGLTEILSLKRFTFLAVLPYKDFMMKYMFEFLAQSDNRQELLQEFQKAFNDIHEDMRSDNEVKYELHCRVKDFQTQLWEICDQKRRECQKKKEDIVRDHWTSGQIVILVNIYLAIMQIEINRFVDTISIIGGYYTSKIEENRMVKPILHRVSFLEESVEDGQKIFDSPPLPSFNKLNLQNEIEKILLAKNPESLELTNTNGFKTIKANIEYCQSFVDTLQSSAFELLEKNDKKSKEIPQNLKSNKKKNGKRKLSKRISKVETKTEDSDEKNYPADVKQSESVLKEWRCVLMYEITRIKTLFKILESSWKSDVEFLLRNIQHGLYLIEEKINETYKNELESIKEMAKIFCLAIEHQQSISGQMILDGDRFFIKFDPFKGEEPIKLLNSFPVEESDDFMFKMVQLGRLNDIFKKIAPSGIIPQRSFVYILQDLISCGEEDDKERILPPSWLKLDPPHVFELVDEIFGNISHIDWREFLVYGMNIEHPTQEQLLDTLEHFRRKDEALSGIIPKSVFVNIPLWFHGILISPSINSWLHEDFEYDDYEYSNRSSEYYDNSRTNSMRTKLKKKTISFRSDSIEKKQLGIDEVTPEDVRLNLAKELLCEIFIENREDVNYLKLLLSFCKDEDPRKGFAKALSVTLNCNVCYNFEEGEKFVEESFRMKENYDILREEIVEELLDQVINRIFDNPEKSVILSADNVSIITDETQIRKSGRISIEILDRPGEILDPASLIHVDTDKSSGGSVTDSRTSSMKESDGSLFSQQTNSDNLLGDDRITREMYYWIPISVLENFLTNLVPNLSEPIIAFSSETLFDNLRIINDETKCQELNDNCEMILAHRVINHRFISRLLDKTSKFTWKNMGKIVRVILQREEKDRAFK